MHASQATNVEIERKKQTPNPETPSHIPLEQIQSSEKHRMGKWV